MLESQRHPLLDQSSRQALEAWREHPRAPRWNTLCGDRLNQDALDSVRLFARECAFAPSWDSFREPPEWVRERASKYLSEVPFYRARGGDVQNWSSIAPCDRLDLAREPWHFVPDGLELDDMVIYNTSGTTASEVLIPSDFSWASRYLPLYERALLLNGVDWPAARQRPESRGGAALATIAAQEHTLTFAAWSSYLGGANLKVNLHPSQWREPSDAVEFLDEADPQVLCGDPVSLSAMAETRFAGRPLGVLSSALALSPGVRERLQARFGCPVIDVYSLNESGPLACSVLLGTSSTWGEGALAILPPDVWIEILRPDGTACEEGEAGEITLTGGRNPFLPLLRYRTGDRARAQVLEEGESLTPLLTEFHGRALVKFDSGGREVLDIDVTHALRRLPLREFSLRQARDGSLAMSFRGVVERAEIEAALRSLFPHNALRIEELEASQGERKLIRYSREAGE